MLKCKMNATPALAMMGLLCFASAAGAQVRDYDTVYPMGAPFTIREKNGFVPAERAEKLNGRVFYNEDGQYYEYSKMRKHHRSNDTVYGKTLDLGIGIGGAHLD